MYLYDNKAGFKNIITYVDLVHLFYCSYFVKEFSLYFLKAVWLQQVIFMQFNTIMTCE